MAKVGHIEVEVKPTVTLESAAACVMMLNLFLDANEEYRVEVDHDGRCRITDEPFVPTASRVYARPISSNMLTDYEKEILADMPALKNLARMAGLETE